MYLRKAVVAVLSRHKVKRVMLHLHKSNFSLMTHLTVSPIEYLQQNGRKGALRFYVESIRYFPGQLRNLIYYLFFKITEGDLPEIADLIPKQMLKMQGFYASNATTELSEGASDIIKEYRDRMTHSNLDFRLGSAQTEPFLQKPVEASPELREFCRDLIQRGLEVNFISSPLLTEEFQPIIDTEAACGKKVPIIAGAYGLIFAGLEKSFLKKYLYTDDYHLNMIGARVFSETVASTIFMVMK